ncbi:MAG TPA: hypothetical protein VHO90_12610, partial [Bacteroidales bacterium]|nr:hypothetical protein [Bacteroidales bacterium]
MDEKIFLRGTSASDQIDSSELLSDVSVFVVEPVDKHTARYFSAADVEYIKSCRLDILVKIGFGNLRGDIVSATRYGIWAYRWGDRYRIEDGLTGFWEVV